MKNSTHVLRAVFGRVFIGVFGSLLVAGCSGYQFQNSSNPLADEGIHKIYISPLVNNTYKPGIENVVYNNLMRTLLAHKRVILVSSLEDADAILTGTVTGSSYAPSSNAQVTQLNPSNVGASLPTWEFYVPIEYTANLTCNFQLTRKGNPRPGSKQKKNLWAATVTKAKPFQASNQLSVPGTTSALINDSEFDRALSDLARGMMEDVHESMLAMF